MRLNFLKCSTIVMLFFAAVSTCRGDEPDAAAESPATDPPTSAVAEIGESQLKQWVAQLASDQYRLRELSTTRLLLAGSAAVPALEAGLQDGDLETTSRILSVLRKLSVAFDPQRQTRDLAWESLERIGAAGASSAATRAQLAMDEVRDDRKQRAMEVLTGAGIFIGFGEYHLASSVVSNNYHMRIPKDWAGNVAALSWLKWLHGVETVILSGDKITADVVKHVANIPDLRNLVIRDTTITVDDLQGLTELSRLDHFQLVNVSAGDELIDTLAELPLRRGLTLFGTDISFEGSERLKTLFPNLDVQCRGGFLGVRCSPLNPNCEVGTVEPNTAAAEAGVRSGDVITKFGEFDVKSFADLQAAIAKHTAAEKPIPMLVNRIVEEQVEVELPKQDGQPTPKLIRTIRRQKTIPLTVKLKRQFP
ncbi:hypothetical protein Poly24_39610 [Rosistilla carotiformis]|uniref:PDZ domain-containing protein n=1 Tax=Rosistilla carotiformis TaxID=2528017 RepID=A0A518JXH8_9BACT|nr:PDZ domain-containing protein [Rosistilla carotiformis]QDV70241.1 hypothetical protein Poly24_39610 [Rosistilla carotiformis]